MRGRFLHNHILIAPVERKFQGLGATVSREHMVEVGNRAGFIDLFVTFKRFRIACEAELSPVRVDNDIAKAVAVNADVLWIIVPNHKTAKTIGRCFGSRLSGSSRLRISILPLGSALECLRNENHFLTLLNVPTENKSSILKRKFGWIEPLAADFMNAGVLMNPERERFLNLRTAPARLNTEEAAWYLGFAVHDIPVLVSKGLLKPLGHPAQSTVKFFALTTLDELRRDAKWLTRATDAITGHWREKNSRRAKNGEQVIENETDRITAMAVE